MNNVVSGDSRSPCSPADVNLCGSESKSANHLSTVCVCVLFVCVRVVYSVPPEYRCVICAFYQVWTTNQDRTQTHC